jgi:hypothetical protein
MELKQKVTKFRQAIEAAKENGEFIRDIVFRDFPSGCCGDASDLLAEYLLHDDIKTKYICGSYDIIR